MTRVQLWPAQQQACAGSLNVMAAQQDIIVQSSPLAAAPYFTGSFTGRYAY
jgi:hypothetical protein